MEHWVYILQSQSTGRYYCGQTDDIKKRLIQHNDPENTFTRTTSRFKGPWRQIHKIECPNSPPPEFCLLNDFFQHLKVMRGNGIYECYFDVGRPLRVYEAGALDRPNKMQIRVIDAKVVVKERKKEFEISRISRFRYRNRYFKDSGIIGSKEFVSENYQRFKHLFYSKHDHYRFAMTRISGI